MLSIESDKGKLFVEIFSKNSNFYDLGVALPALPSRTNLKLHNIPLTPKFVKKVISDLYSSKAFGPDRDTFVVLKNCDLNFRTC